MRRAIKRKRNSDNTLGSLGGIYCALDGGRKLKRCEWRRFYRRNPYALWMSKKMAFMDDKAYQSHLDSLGSKWKNLDPAEDPLATKNKNAP